MKKIMFLSMCIGVLLLSGCGGNKYDEVIDELVKNKRADLIQLNRETKTKGYTEDLKREDCSFEVFDNGKYIKFSYKRMEDSKKKIDLVYMRNGNGEYVREHSDSIKGLIPDYVEIDGKEQK